MSCPIGINKVMFSSKEYPLGYSKEVYDAIKLLTIKPSNIVLFGTGSLKSMIYAGDIDLIEPMNLSQHAKAMKQVVKKIMSNKDYGTKYQMGDIKAGRQEFGEILMDAVGTLDKQGNIINYDPETIEQIFIEYGIQPDFEMIKSTNIDIKQWVKVYKFCHNIETLRWTPEEILKGKHKQTGITLEQATVNSQLNKIDLYFFVSGKFMEITNVFTDASKQIDKEELLTGLRVNLATYLYSDKPNYLKSIKRANAISRLTGNCEYMEKVKNFLVGQVALLNSVKTDLDVLPVMFEHGYKLNKQSRDYLSSHFGLLINKLSNVYVIEPPQKLFFNLQTLQENTQNECPDKNKLIHSFVNLIETSSDTISQIVNELAKEFVKKANIDFNKFV